MADLKKLLDRRAALTATMRELSDKASGEERSFSEEENATYRKHEADLEANAADVAREKKLQEYERNLQPVADGNQLNPKEQAAHKGLRAGELDPKPAWEKDPKKGFSDPAEFLTGVLDAARTGTCDDPRLRYQAAVGSDEQSTFADPYGGFLIPKAFSPNLLSLPSEADPIANLTTKVPMESAVLEIPARVDKNHSSSVSGGLRVYRRAEADTVTSSRMEFEQVKLTATSLFGIAYATEELLQRSPMSFIALLEAGFSDEFGAKLLSERLGGTGAGMFEGVNNAPCLITQGKETGQAATTIVYENIVKMRARCWRYGGAVWLANHDTLPQLMTLTIAVGTGGVPIWQPSAREDHPDLLLGRPLHMSEFAQTLGTNGDLLLGNWSQYLEGTLTTAQQAESIHVRFINHERTFKFWLENDGRSWWRSALTPRVSTTTLSPFVRLQSRT
jgi:HK97 family phage major capsid protein